MRSRCTHSNASHIPKGMGVTLRPRRHSAIHLPKEQTKCLRRILLCAWSTRQRTCFLIRRARSFASSRTSSARCRAVRAFLSRTGSSSYAIRDSGSSAYVDSSTSQAPPSFAPATMRGDVSSRHYGARLSGCTPIPSSIFFTSGSLLAGKIQSKQGRHSAVRGLHFFP
jgi:hypothetical protein